MTVKSFLQTVLIEDIKNNKDNIIAQCFTPDDQMKQLNNHVRSTAGRIALKLAICALAKEIFFENNLLPKDVIIEKDDLGAPCLTEVRMSDSKTAHVIKTEIFLSVSHSRTTAAGIAAISVR